MMKNKIHFFKTKDGHYVFARVFVASINNLVLNTHYLNTHSLNTGIWLGSEKNRWAWQRDDEG